MATQREEELLDLTSHNRTVPSCADEHNSVGSDGWNLTRTNSPPCPGIAATSFPPSKLHTLISRSLDVEASQDPLLFQDTLPDFFCAIIHCCSHTNHQNKKRKTSEPPYFMMPCPRLHCIRSRTQTGVPFVEERRNLAASRPAVDTGDPSYETKDRSDGTTDGTDDLSR